LIKEIKTLNLIASDLISLIIEYERYILYSNEPIQVWNLSSQAQPQGMISDNKFLYICDFYHGSISMLNLGGFKVYERISFVHLSDLDIDQNYLFAIDEFKVWIFDLLHVNKFTLLFSFQIPPSTSSLPSNHIKADKKLIYITIDQSNQILVYTREGRFQSMIGTAYKSSKPGEYNEPAGMTVDSNTLYICDSRNHRIQAINKDKYTFQNQWGSYGTLAGELNAPDSIYYNEEILFVGDNDSLSLFLCNGTFLQRIGEDKVGNGEGQFCGVLGVCVVKNRVYVSDTGNSRIQVFGLNC